MASHRCELSIDSMRPSLAAKSEQFARSQRAKGSDMTWVLAFADREAETETATDDDDPVVIGDEIIIGDGTRP